MVRTLEMAEASLAARREASRLGMAMAAMMPMIATTISSSMSEKPFCPCFCSISFQFSFSDPVQGRLDEMRGSGLWARPSFDPCSLRVLVADDLAAGGGGDDAARARRAGGRGVDDAVLGRGEPARAGRGRRRRRADEVAG